MLRSLMLSLALAAPLPALAQSAMDGVDMTLPKMVEAQLSRAEVAARLDAASADAPADFTRVWLNGLDLSGLDFSGAVLRAAEKVETSEAGSQFDILALTAARVASTSAARTS